MSEITASAKAMEEEKPTSGKSRGGGSRKKNRVAEPSFNMNEIRELAELVDQHGLTDFEFENENIRVRLSKQTAAPMMQAAPLAAATPAAVTQPETAATPEPEVDSDAELHKITSPIVGTFYRSPGPDKEPYVKEGSTVSADSVVCIVEAMKLMNEIQAEVAGEIVKVYVENGQPVEYGQPLFGIKR
jgi:acetyl-CoA carboxylase biotin carboxyl carrier protein